MMPSKEKEVWSRIITLYRDSPILWDITNKNYLNRAMKEKSYQVLLDIYKEWDEEATIDLIKKKIKNMRTCYARELKKVKSGAKEESYTPTLWYFEMFSFLQKITERSFDAHPTLNEVYCEVIDTPYLATFESTGQSTDSDDQNESDMPRKKMRTCASIKPKDVSQPESVQQTWTTKEQDWEIMGKCIGIQLKDLNKDQLIIVNKLISDVIFYAKSGQLTLESSIDLGTSVQSEAYCKNVQQIKSELDS